MNDTIVPGGTGADDAEDERLAALVGRYLHLLPMFADQFPSLPAVEWPALTEAQRRDRARGALLGVAVAEALTGDVPGHWGAGTATALCLAQSLQRVPGALDQYDLAQRLSRWMNDGEPSAGGVAVEVDDETRQALARFAQDDEPAAGVEGDGRSGYGALRRLVPLAIAFAGDRDRARVLAIKQARVTHGGREGLDACELFIVQLIDALQGASAEQAVRPRVMNLVPRVLALDGGEGLQARPAPASAGPDAVDTLRAAWWAVLRADSFAAAVWAVTDLPGDSRGAVAVAGALAGALWGAAALPADELAGLLRRQEIEDTADALFELSRAFQAG